MLIKEVQGQYQELADQDQDQDQIQERERERLRLSAFLGDRGHRGPYKPCNNNLYMGIVIFPHIDNKSLT